MLLLLGLVLCGLSWLAPGHYVPWIMFQNEVAAAAAGLVLGLAAFVAARGQRLPVPRIAVLVFAVALVPAAQTVLGQIRFTSDGVFATAYVLAFGMAITVGASLARFDRNQFLPSLFLATLVAGFASTGIGLAQWLEIGPLPYIEPIPPGGRPFGNLLQPNHLATLLVLSLVAALWFYEKRRIGGLGFAALTAWFCVGLVATRSRTAWVALFVFALLWLLMRRRFAVRLSMRAMACTCAVFVVATALWGPLSEWASVAAPVSLTDRVQSGTGRLNFWATLLEGLRASPWVGYGWTQVSKAAVAGSALHYTGESMLRNSHNVLLDLLIWNGVPLGLSIIAALAWWFLRRLTACRSTDNWLLLAGVSAVLVHALLEYPLEYLHFLIPTGLMMGALDTPEGSASQFSVPRSALLGPLLLLLGLTGWVSAEYLRVEEGSRQGRMVMAGYARSAEPPDVVLLDEPREYIKLWRTEAVPGMSREDLDWMRDIVERNPSPPALLRMALALGLNGRLDDAHRTLVQLCNMHKKERCDEGRGSWTTLQGRYPALLAIDYPATPSP